MKNVKRLVCAFLIVALLLTICACTKETATENAETEGTVKSTSDETVTLDFMFMFDWGNKYDWDECAAELITEKTGVELNYSVVAGDGNEKSLAMLMADNYPDLLYLKRDDVFNQYVAGDKVYAINDLAEEYGYDKMLTEYIYPEVVSLISSEDGKLYGIPDEYCSSSGEGASGIGGGFNVRKDLYDQVQPGEIKTMEDLYNVCVDIKESGLEYDGQKVYPFDINYSLTWLENFGNIWGEQISQNRYYDEDDNAVYCSVKSDAFRQGMAYINRMLREDMMDEEMLAITEWTTRQEKWASGRYFMVFTNMWDLWTPTTALKERDENATFAYSIPIPEGNEGVQPYVKPFTITGQNVTVITKNNEYPEETMKFFDYILSPEGQTVQFYGVEGNTWDYVDGQAMLYDEYIEAMSSDWTATRNETGIRKWSFWRDGKYNWERFQEPTERIEARTLASAAIFDGTILDFAVDPNSEAGIIYSTLYGNNGSVIINDLTNILLSDTEAEFDAAYDELLQKLEDGNIAVLEQAWTDKYLELKAKLD